LIAGGQASLSMNSNLDVLREHSSLFDPPGIKYDGNLKIKEPD
jgi:hypothetical protein